MPGDLVMVVHTCCQATLHELAGKHIFVMGVPRTVKSIVRGSTRCKHCCLHCVDIHIAELGDIHANLLWLKKINPPAVKDSTETDKEISCLT